MEKQNLKIAIVSMTSSDKIEKNVSIISKLVLKAASAKAEIVFFPENCLFFRVKEGTAVTQFSLSSSEFDPIIKIATEKSIVVHLGSVPILKEGKVFNSSIIIDSKGHIRMTYSKIHLFDIQLANQTAIRESDIFDFGLTPSIFMFKGWKFGESICYDIRFSELYHRYALSNVDVILIPSSFLKKTGEAHWYHLNQARAIESQCYVISSAQAGRHKSELYPGEMRETFGHSLVVGPWGEILVDVNDEDRVETLILTKNEISKVRTQIPMAKHRKSFISLSRIQEISIV